MNAMTPSSGKSDELLIEEVKKGSRSSFGLLYKRYRNAIYNYLYYILGTSQTAEDCTQDVFIRLFDKASLYREPNKFSSWIYRMAKNIAFDALRKMKVRRARSLDEALGSSDSDITLKDVIADKTQPRPDQTAQTKELLARLETTLRQLSENDQQLIVLCDLQELKHEDVAQIMDYKTESVPVMLHRAKKRLAELMRKGEEKPKVID